VSTVTSSRHEQAQESKVNYPLPSIFIEPRRRERMAERSDQVSSAVFTQLRDELHTALLNDPQAKVWTPGFRPTQQPAADIFFDDYAGIDSDERQHRLVKLLADAAKGENVQVRAAELIADLCTRHAEFHLGDALVNEEW